MTTASITSWSWEKSVSVNKSKSRSHSIARIFCVGTKGAFVGDVDGKLLVGETEGFENGEKRDGELVTGVVYGDTDGARLAGDALGDVVCDSVGDSVCGVKGELVSGDWVGKADG